MGIDTYTPAQLAAYLRNQDLLGLRRLQVGGQAQLDGGLVTPQADVGGPLTARRIAVTPDKIALPGDVWQEIVLPTGLTNVNQSNVGVSIQNIPQSYRTLVIDYEGQFQTGNGVSYAWFRFNNDATSGHYYWERLSYANNAATVIDSNGVFITAIAIGFFVEQGASGGTSSWRVVIENYARGSNQNIHSLHSAGSWFLNGTLGSYGGYVFGGVWTPAVAAGINQIDISTSSGGGQLPIFGVITVRLLGGLPVA